MATQTTKTTTTNKDNKSTTTIGDLGLTGDDFVTTAQAFLQLAAQNQQEQSQNLQTIINFQQQGLQTLVAANAAGTAAVRSSINPNDVRQYLPYVFIGMVTIFGAGAIWKLRG